MKDRLVKSLVFILIFISLMGLFYLGISPIKKTIDYCEEKEWDGSEYDTGIREIKLVDSENIKVKCNKEKDETDAIIGIVDSLFFWDADDEQGGAK